LSFSPFDAMTKTMHDRIVRSILITGIFISCIYWVCESFMFFFLEPQANFFQHLLGPNMFQTFTRVLVLCLFAIFGSHIQYTVNKEREADAALRASEDKYRNILESIEEGYFETDLRGNLTFFNGALCRILGYGAAELRGKNTREFTPEETAARTNDVLAGVERTGEPAAVVAYQVVDKDNNPKDLELSVSLIRDPWDSRRGSAGWFETSPSACRRSRRARSSRPAPAGPENGGHRDACRRHRPRLQQHPDGHPGQRLPA
jgi:PAS domain S-box-containing protein